MDRASWEKSHGAFSMPKEVFVMGYRKVSYPEQIWYILRYKLREFFRKEDKRAK